MEAGDPAAGQSGITSASNPELYDQHRLHQLHKRDPYDRQYREQPHTMATAALISPSTPYHGHPPSFSSSYPHSAPPTSIAGMISPVEPRRGSDDSDSSHRQSLPSISEVINKANAYPPQPTPSTTMPGSGFPSPYGSAPSRSSFAEERHSPPRPVHPTYTQVPEPNPTYAEPGRAFSSSRPPPPPPLSTLAGPNPSPPMRTEHEGPRSAESHQVNGSYSHMPPAPSHYPPGQQPLPPFTGSPGHAGPAPIQSSYESQGRPAHHEEDFPRGRYDHTVNRHFEQWSYQEHLSRIASSSRTVYNFAEAYGRIAQEQHGPAHIPERWPSEREVADMIACADYIKKSLEGLRDVVQNVMAERARESGKAKGPYDEEDVAMYGDGMKPQYQQISEPNKRKRGRAAPPGRCHSCNRIDTPEWRRGPDGARTLCNACGLHYAKLERKRQLEARSIRPQPDDQ